MRDLIIINGHRIPALTAKEDAAEVSRRMAMRRNERNQEVKRADNPKPSSSTLWLRKLRESNEKPIIELLAPLTQDVYEEDDIKRELARLSKYSPNDEPVVIKQRDPKLLLGINSSVLPDNVELIQEFSHAFDANIGKTHVGEGPEVLNTLGDMDDLKPSLEDFDNEILEPSSVMEQGLFDSSNQINPYSSDFELEETEYYI